MINGFSLWGALKNAAESGLSYAEASLTSQQIKALLATPITLVPAIPGGIIELISLELILDYGTNVFTNPQDPIVRYASGGGVAACAAIPFTGFIDTAGDMRINVLATTNQRTLKSQCQNVPLVIHNNGASEITGNAANDSVLRIKTSYRVHTSGW